MNKRNIGLDILRSISMLMIVVLHYLGKGGILWNSDENMGIWSAAWLLEALCLVSVNCYILSSAYFLSGSDKGIRWSKVIELLACMCFYSWITGGVLFVTGTYKFGLMDIVCTVFPFLTNSYWFINVYILMYLLHPYLNKALNGISQKEHKVLLGVGLFFLCVLPSVLPVKSWSLDETGGYGIPWFLVLYVTGAYVRKYGLNMKKPLAFLGWLACGAICFASYFALTLITTKLGRGASITGIWYSYNSIPVFLGSVCLFMAFVNWKCVNNAAAKVIGFLSAGTLGVYLFHEQHKLRQILWSDILQVPNYHNSWMLFVYMIPVVLGIFLLGVLLDHCRIQLFKAVKRLKK